MKGGGWRKKLDERVKSEGAEEREEEVWKEGRK